MEKVSKTIMIQMDGYKSKKPRPDSRFKVRYILPSDCHPFVGRLYDLGIVAYNFESYDEIEQYPDCKYAVECGWGVKLLTQRVESLNMVGSMLWPEPFPAHVKSWPVSPYEWLVIAADIFLVRYVSTVDCALMLINEVYELGLPPKFCRLEKMRKSLPRELLTLISQLQEAQGPLGQERHSRVHHGIERHFTDDDRTFRSVSVFEHRGQGMTGRDQHGRKINLNLFFREGLVGLQRDFNKSTRQLICNLDCVYDVLWKEFESRFGPRIAAATHGFNARAMQNSN